MTERNWFKEAREFMENRQGYPSWPCSLDSFAIVQVLAEFGQASAREQARIDAKICLSEQVDAEATGEATDQAYNLACEHCSDAIGESFSREAGTPQKSKMGYCDHDHRYPSPTMEGQGPQHPHIKVQTCKNWREAGTQEKK